MQHNFLYSVEREYSQPMARIWEAWTDAAQLEAWYHPTVLTNVVGSSVSEPVVGGNWAIAVDVPEHNMQSCFWGQYTAVEEGKLLEHTMFYTQDPAEFVAKDLSGEFAKVVVDFEERPTGTWVRFSQYGELPEEHIPLAKAGMESYFQSLADYLG
ncbi:SRPBCC family protein [Aurantimicrobium minutum]|uniref:SRPBCC family protein n=1 Tax=Aurantimicrobium minutum TaxID=708131 RepID=UPI00247698D6|nr:SRPBCC domain-containing protein [Aurantimicrobium minutum]MDH6422979.1 uncharacterized protein YndB with AHSA1/START domain [Aurantimicrobium minutum]